MIGRLGIEISVSRSSVHLTVEGEIDIETAPQLLDTVLSALLIEATDAVPEVVLDLSGVTFLDSSGIAALLYARRYVASHGATLVIAKVSNIAAKTIDLAGVTGTLDIAPAQSDVDPV